MTVIKLGNVSLHVGMTKAEAEYNDEKIKEANHGKTPVDKNGKVLQPNVSLFTKYDTNKDGVIDIKEYKKWQEDNKKAFNDMMKKTEQDVKNMWENFKNGNSQNSNNSRVYIL